jgi:Tfp pilus assembly protein PilN
MRAVNLLPREVTRTGRRLPSPWVLLAATVPVVAGSLVYLGYSHEHSTVVNKQAELAAVQAQIDKLTARKAGVPDQSSLLALKGTRLGAVQDALSKSMAWDVTLEDLARVLPRGVTLTGLNAQSPTPAGTAPTLGAPAATGASQSLTLQGVAGNHGQIAELLERLSLLPMLTNVTLGGTSTVVQTSSAPAATGQGAAASGTSSTPAPTVVQFSVSAGLQQLPEGSGT